MLSDELGLDPGPQLLQLHQQILEADPRLAAITSPELHTARAVTQASASGSPGQPDLISRRHGVVRRQLPAGVRQFAGRERDELLGQAGGPGAAVVITTISGMAGIGKTSLAVHWAHRVAGHFPDGQLYVNLRGYDPPGSPVTPAEAIRGFLDALAVPAGQIPASLAAQEALYRSLLARRSMMIVLDNASDPSRSGRCAGRCRLPGRRDQPLQPGWPDRSRRRGPDCPARANRG
jgi:hypothetical protein